MRRADRARRQMTGQFAGGWFPLECADPAAHPRLEREPPDELDVAAALS